MEKKSFIVSWCITGVLFLALVCILIAGKNDIANTSSEADKSKTAETDAAEEALKRIEPFTKNYFRYFEDMRIEENNGKLAIYVSYVPEVGSFPVKLDIYERAAYHALQITRFYPEVTFFQYDVLWDWYDSQTETFDRKTAITLTIDEPAVQVLSGTYYDAQVYVKEGVTSAYENVFSSIEETEESETWRFGTEKVTNGSAG